MRYAAVRCHPAAAADWQARAVAAGLQPADPCGEFNLFTAADTPVRVIYGWAIVGEWHGRAGGGGSKLSGPESRHVPLTGWGRYVALRCDQGSAEIFRDPSAGLPCYHVRRGTADLFVSGADVAQRLGALDAAGIDEAFLVHWLQYPHLRSGRTGLTGVDELAAGTARRWTGERWSDEPRWQPEAIAKRPLEGNLKIVAEQLKAVVLDAVERQLADRPLLLQLSGGLDSSILAVSLAERKVPFEAVTFATRSADGDERHYAAAAAQRCGAALHIVEETDGAALPAVLPVSFRPGPNLLVSVLDEAIEQVRAQCDAWLVDGAGGDNLFGSSSTAAPAADGLLSGRPGAIGDVARRSGSSWWKAMSYALSSLAGRYRTRKWPEDRSFLARGVLLPASDGHPWLRRVGRLPPGKQEHVGSLLHIQSFLDRHASGSRLLHPLLAQPILELCLRTPSWLTVAGGTDRAVARQAFAGLLPPLVAARRSKGSLEGLLYRRFVQLQPRLRELLLDGELARRGLLDRPAIEATSGSDSWHATNSHVRLSEIATLELWFQGALSALGRRSGG